MIVATRGEKKSRRDDGKYYSVFIASSDDCDDLRSATKEVFDKVNEDLSPVSRKFVVFDWKEDNTARKSDGDFQDWVFKNAENKWRKKKCDIFVMLLWYKFPKYTLVEYDRYVNKAKNKDNSRLFCCHFGAPVKPTQLAGAKVDQLLRWISKNNKDWAEISPVRGSIENVAYYRECLRSQLYKFLSEKS